MSRYQLFDHFDEEEWQDIVQTFAEPYIDSALKVASADISRNLPCPKCKRPNMLTPSDKNLGCRCNICADRGY